MAMLNFVVSKYITDFDGNVEVDIQQMMDGSDYEIVDPHAFIAECIFESIENYIDFRYDYAAVYKLMQRDGIYRLGLIEDEESAVSSIILCIDNKNKTYSYDMQGDIKVRQIFSVTQIEDINVAYLVSEHIIRPSDTCDLIERCYRPFFDDLFAATRYMNHKMKEYNTEHGSINSGYRISVVDKSVIENSEWYKLNMKVANIITQYHLDAEDYRYIEDINEVVETVAADAYDDLDLDFQNEINMNIYDKISCYLDSDTKEEFDLQLDTVPASEICDIVDNAILSALIFAKDKETFMAIHEALGPHDYRVGSFTDDIYNEHPDKGHILLSSAGEFEWYNDCYALNEWEGAKDTPYYHKFMPNENDTLLCLREYHPELIVDNIPDATFVTKYKSMYKSSLAEKRKQHDEMIITMNDNIEYVIGDWYNKGLYSSDFVKNAVFPRKYEKYVFTVDECKQLLSGIEIVVDNYVSKAGILCSMRGYLSEVSGPYDQNPRYGFRRSDIGGTKRVKLNDEFGIREPGIASMDDI